jgi:hypothetical protein
MKMAIDYALFQLFLASIGNQRLATKIKFDICPIVQYVSNRKINYGIHEQRTKSGACSCYKENPQEVWDEGFPIGSQLFDSLFEDKGCAWAF